MSPSLLDAILAQFGPRFDAFSVKGQVSEVGSYEVCANVDGWGTGWTQPCMLAQLRAFFTAGGDSPDACRPP